MRCAHVKKMSNWPLWIHLTILECHKWDVFTTNNHAPGRLEIREYKLTFYSCKEVWLINTYKMSAAICVSKTYKILKYELLTHIIIKCIGDWETVFKEVLCNYICAINSYILMYFQNLIWVTNTYGKSRNGMGRLVPYQDFRATLFSHLNTTRAFGAQSCHNAPAEGYIGEDQIPEFLEKFHYFYGWIAVVILEISQILYLEKPTGRAFLLWLWLPLWGSLVVDYVRWKNRGRGILLQTPLHRTETTLCLGRGVRGVGIRLSGRQGICVSNTYFYFSLTNTHSEVWHVTEYQPIVQNLGRCLVLTSKTYALLTHTQKSN